MAHGDDETRSPVDRGAGRLPDEAPWSNAARGGPTLGDSQAVRETTSEFRLLKSIIHDVTEAFKKIPSAVRNIPGAGGATGGGGAANYNAAHYNFNAQQQAAVQSFGLQNVSGLPTGPQATATPNGGWGWRQRASSVRSGIGNFARTFYDDPNDMARLQFFQQTSQIAAQVGGGMNRYMAGATGQASVLDWAATQRTQLAGRYEEGRRETYNRSMARYGNVRGWQDLGDLSQAAMLNNRISGGSMGQLQQLGIGGMLNPTIGIAGAAQAYNQMLQPRALHAMVPFGGGAVENYTGRRRQMDEMLSQYALTATGASGYGKGEGQLNRKWASATFREGGQGRQNLRSLGMSEEMIDMVMTYSTQSAVAGRALDLDDARDVRQGGFNSSYLHNVQKGAQRRGERDVRIFEDSRDAQMNFNDAVGRFSQAVGQFVDATGSANALFGAGKVGQVIGGLGQTGMLSLGLNALMNGGMLGGGGPGGPGLLSRIGGMGRMGAVGATAIRAAGGAGLGYMAGSVVDAAIPGDKGWGGAAGGAAKWGLTGAGLGAMVGGPMGAAIGGGIGAVTGGIGGFFGVGDPETDSAAGGPLPPGDNVGLHPTLDRALRRMFADNPKLRINSGRRSTAEQHDLFMGRHHEDPNGKYSYMGKRWSRNRGAPPTAVPGRSKHEKGLAADIGPSSEYGWLAANASKYGLKKTVANEPWHFEPVGVSDAAGSGTEAAVGGSSSPALGTTGGSLVLSAAASGGLNFSGFGSLGGASGAKPVVFGGGGIFGGSVAEAGGAPAGGNGGASGDILATLRAAGFEGEGLRMAYAIAMAESGGDASAVSKPNKGAHAGSRDHGLFQINDKYHAFARGGSVYNALANAQYANKISADGTNWNAWSTFKSGAYKKHYDAAIGDGIVEPSGGGGGTITASRQVIVQQVHLNVRIDQVSESEARRLGDLFMATLAEREQRAVLGGG
jgi:hypothetical protein